MGVYNNEAKKLTSLRNSEKKDFAVEKLLPLIKQEAEELLDIHKYLISSLTTWGSIGNIANWQQHIIPGQILPQINQVVKITGDSLWVKGLFPDNIAGLSGIIVPSPQTMIKKGQDYTVKVICYNIKPKEANIYWRPLGEKDFKQTGLKKISDTYWIATIPSAGISDDFEYYIRMEDKKEYLFPASAPSVNHAVVLTAD